EGRTGVTTNRAQIRNEHSVAIAPKEWRDIYISVNVIGPAVQKNHTLTSPASLAVSAPGTRSEDETITTLSAGAPVRITQLNKTGIDRMCVSTHKKLWDLEWVLSRTQSWQI